MNPFILWSAPAKHPLIMMLPDPFFTVGMVFSELKPHPFSSIQNTDHYGQTVQFLSSKWLHICHVGHLHLGDIILCMLECYVCYTCNTSTVTYMTSILFTKSRCLIDFFNWENKNVVCISFSVFIRKALVSAICVYT